MMMKSPVTLLLGCSLLVFALLSWLTVRNQEGVEFDHFTHDISVQLHVVTDNFADMQNITAYQLLTLQQQFRQFGQLDYHYNYPQSFASRFQNMMESNPDFTQIRFLDASGREKIRLERQSGEIVAIPEAELQDKSRRYYFTQASALSDGQVYISPIDPNVEHGVVVQPLQPTIRIATPAYDSRGEFTGVLVVNRNLSGLLSLLLRDIPGGYRQVRLHSMAGVWDLSAAGSGQYRYSTTSESLKDRQVDEYDLHPAQRMEARSTWVRSELDPLKFDRSVFPAMLGKSVPFRLELKLDPAVRFEYRKAAMAKWLPLNFVLVGLFSLLLVYMQRMQYRNRQVRDDLAQSARLLQAEQRARDAELQSRELIEANINGILTADDRGIILQTNIALDLMFGYGRGELIGQPVEMLLDPEVAEAHAKQRKFFLDVAVGTSRMSQRVVQAKKKDGHYVPVDISLSVIEREDRKLVAATVIDLSERIRTEKRLTELMHYDELTGLPNRLFTVAKLDASVESARTHGWSFACIYTDLDFFKNINDSLGHEAGDDLLIQVARRIQSTLGENDLLSRLVGDKFLIIVHSFNSFDRLSNHLNGLMQCFARAFHVAGEELLVRASFGISVFPSDGESADELLRAAEVAMYQAKKSGRNNCCFHSRELTEEVQERTNIERDLAMALDRGELQLHYQPQFDIDKDDLIGFEALLRWNHSELGYISPVKFIPIAENSGLIHEIGDWVLHEACRQASEWLDLGLKFEHISVNVSGVQVQRGRLLERASSVLAETGLPENKLELELTEGFVMSQEEIAIAQLEEIRRLGISLAIDDFGTGYSSLAYLKRLPVHKIKIDKSFILDIPDDLNDVAITQAIIAMAESLRLKVIAEGVETEAQKQFLYENGCMQIQGYLYSKPLTAAQISERFLSVKGVARSG